MDFGLAPSNNNVLIANRDTSGKFFTPAELARIMVEIIPKKQNLMEAITILL